MIQTIRRTFKGMCYLDSCGYHPGTGVLICFILMGGIAGARNNDVWGFVKGAGIMGGFIAPIYLMGCYDRGKIEEEVTLKKLTQGSSHDPTE
jgi:hypothetical protein